MQLSHKSSDMIDHFEKKLRFNARRATLHCKLWYKPHQLQDGKKYSVIVGQKKIEALRSGKSRGDMRGRQVMIGFLLRTTSCISYL